MAYHTLSYLAIFLPVVLMVYQLAPQRARGFILLAAGYFFFWSFSGMYVLYLVGLSAVTYGIARGIENKRNKKQRNTYFLVMGICILFGGLLYLKYTNFFLENLKCLLVWAQFQIPLKASSALAPIGISFYTLQAVGYLTDVYWERYEAEKNFFKLALYLAFFPQIMEGPIANYQQTADALWQGNSIKYQNLVDGMLRIGWGLFKKMVIADRLYILVNEVFSNYRQYQGAIVLVAAIGYVAQLYMEFSGCMDIVIGSGNIFGVTLPENFRQPFLSKSASEFWRRWHITLGVWLKAYIFYPITISPLAKKWNRFAKKHCNRYWKNLGMSAMALFPVWLFNGLWHGPQWNYLFYGMYYFVILMAELALEPLWKAAFAKRGLDEKAKWWQSLRMCKTWIIIVVGEVFFRADTVKQGFIMLGNLTKGFTLRHFWDGTLLKVGLDVADYTIILAGCLVVGIFGLLRERNMVDIESLRGRKLPIRWAVYYALIISIVIFGAYGDGYQPVDLIYANF